MLRTVVPPFFFVEPGEYKSIARRIAAEFREMPGLSLTEAQALRLFNLREPICSRLLSVLVSQGVLRRSADGQYRLTDNGF